MHRQLEHHPTHHTMITVITANQITCCQSTTPQQGPLALVDHNARKQESQNHTHTHPPVTTAQCTTFHAPAAAGSNPKQGRSEHDRVRIIIPQRLQPRPHSLLHKALGATHQPQHTRAAHKAVVLYEGCVDMAHHTTLPTRRRLGQHVQHLQVMVKSRNVCSKQVCNKRSGLAPFSRSCGHAFVCV